jgi:hypothetical protein
MHNLPRARFTAPALHAILFAVACVLMWSSNKPIFDGPAGIPFGVLWVADLPISALAFSVMFTSAEHDWLAWSLWGILGTAWWYFLGLSIEAWIRRFRRRSEK